MDSPDVRRVFVEAHRLGIGTSPVAQWLLTNAREFAAEMERVRRPNWAKLAQTLYEQQSVGGESGAVSGRALRDAWYRVRLYLAERGEEWVEFKEPPRGRGARRVKRKKAAAVPVRAVEPVCATAAPATATEAQEPERGDGGGLLAKLAKRDRERGLPKTEAS
jgi:hypothetical protein